jgi:hypothetical protein
MLLHGHIQTTPKLYPGSITVKQQLNCTIIPSICGHVNGTQADCAGSIARDTLLLLCRTRDLRHCSSKLRPLSAIGEQVTGSTGSESGVLVTGVIAAC